MMPSCGIGTQEESMKVRIPFIPLRGQTFFPNTIVGFDIGRDKSLKS